LDDRGQLAPADARGHVDTLVALGTPHIGWSIGFREPSRTLTGGLRRGLFVAMPGVLGIARLVARNVARRVGDDLSRVRDKIHELARGELGDPLPMTSVHTSEMRQLVEAANALLARMSDLSIGRFLAIERAAEADRQKTQFFANMSHDLR